jgi:hypothetical protein
MEEELRQMEEAASAQRREIENNPRQNDIFYVSLIKNDKQKKEKKLSFLNHLLALDSVFSTKSEEQEVNLVWPKMRDLLIFIFILKTTCTFTPVHSAGYLILRNEFRSTQEIARPNIHAFNP